MTSQLFCALVACVTLVCCSDPGGTSRDARVLWFQQEQGILKPAFDSERAYFLGANHDVVAIEKASGRVSWRSPTEGTGPLPGENLVVAGDVVVAPVGTLFGFDAGTGERLWRLQLQSGDAIGYSYIATDGVAVFTGGPSGVAYAIEAGSGEVRWATPLGPADGSVRVLNPTVGAGLVFVGVRDVTTPSTTTGALVALDAQTGEEVWRYDFMPEFPWQGAGCAGGAVVHGDAVLVTSDDGRVHSFEASSGVHRWTSPRRLTPEDEASPVQFDQRWLASVGAVVVATSLSGFLTGIDPASGDVVWGGELPSGGVLEPPSPDGDRVYTSHVAGQISAINATDGQLLWESGAWTGSSSGYSHPPTPDGERLYLSGNSRLEALRR